MAYSRTLNHFTSMQELATIWASSTSYLVNQPVIHNNFLYRCAIAHTSSGSFQTDLAAGNWERVSSAENGINWASSTYYVLNQLVVESDKLYKCLVAHTSGGSFITDLQAARWVEISASEAGVFNYIGNPDAEVDASGWTTYAESDSVTFTDAGDLVTLNNHGLSNGNEISFTSITSTTGISVNTRYFVVSATTNTFQVASSSGGSALPLTTNGSGTMVRFVPKTGSGGSPNITWSRSIVSPLRGDADFNLVKDAANRQGQGVEYDFTIDNADLAKVLTVTFDYEVVSGTLATGDVTVYLIQDPSGTPLVIQPAGYQVQGATVGTKMRQIATFQTSSTVTSYRLCLHVSSVSATAYTLAVDNVVVGPQVVQYGAPVTDWQSYTPTGAWTSNVTYSGKYRRVGDSVEIQATVVCSGAPNAATFSLSLPTGLSVDSSKIADPSAPAGARTALGVVSVLDASISIRTGVAVWDGSAIRAYSADSLGDFVINATQPIAFGAGDCVALNLKLPILGWSSSVQMSNDTDTRVVAAKYSGGSSAYGANAFLQYNSKDFDTHNAVTTGASWNFLAPVSGYYSVFLSGTRSSSGNQTHTLYKNSTTFVQSILTNISASGKYDSGGTTVYLNAGESISIKTDNAATIEVGYISIERLSGPSAIAASETVAASYWLSANQAVTAGVTNVNFDTREFDTHGAVTTGASWAFTAPISGTYCFALTVETNGNTAFAAYKNGSIYKYIAVNPSANVTGGGSALIRLNAGDTINIRTNATVTVRGQLTMPSLPSQIHIHRIGN